MVKSGISTWITSNLSRPPPGILNLALIMITVVRLSLSQSARSCRIYSPDPGFNGMVKATDYELIEGRKYRLFTRYYMGVVLVYRGLSEDGNPLFVHDVFPVQMIPWPAIEKIEPFG